MSSNLTTTWRKHDEIIMISITVNVKYASHTVCIAALYLEFCMMIDPINFDALSDGMLNSQIWNGP